VRRCTRHSRGSVRATSSTVAGSPVRSGTVGNETVPVAWVFNHIEGDLAGRVDHVDVDQELVELIGFVVEVEAAVGGSRPPATSASTTVAQDAGATGGGAAPRSWPFPERPIAVTVSGP